MLVETRYTVNESAVVRFEELVRGKKSLYKLGEQQENGQVSRRKRTYVQVATTGASSALPVATAIEVKSEYG